jgi:hypothetical protein
MNQSPNEPNLAIIFSQNGERLVVKRRQPVPHKFFAPGGYVMHGLTDTEVRAAVRNIHEERGGLSRINTAQGFDKTEDRMSAPPQQD